MSELYSEKYFKSEDSRWLVLLHGFAGSIGMWKKQTDALKEKYNLLIIDLPGHGKSKGYLHKSKIKSFSEIGELIVEKMQEEGITKATFLCLSLGSMVFAGLLKNHPEVVEGAVLCGAVAGVSWLITLIVNILIKFIRFIPYMKLMKLCCIVLLPLKSHKLIRRLFTYSAKRLGSDEFKAWCKLCVKDLKILKQLNSVKDKILFISGDEDYVFLSGVKKKVSELKNAELKVIDKCGHVCNIQKYNEVNNIISSWLNTELGVI